MANEDLRGRKNNALVTELLRTESQRKGRRIEDTTARERDQRRVSAIKAELIRRLPSAPPRDEPSNEELITTILAKTNIKGSFPHNQYSDSRVTLADARDLLAERLEEDFPQGN